MADQSLNIDVPDGHFKVDPRFVDLRPIGCGGNGIVYSATDSDCDKTVAIKRLGFIDKKSCKYVLREIRIMRRLQHDNIVRIYEILGPNGYGLDRHVNSNISHTELKSLYLVQELLNTDVKQLIEQGVLTEEHTRLFMYQLLRGLKYIHSANVVHRDLKPANLLVNVEDLVLKIADFGLASIVDSDYSHKGFLTDGVGTCWYRSPELIVSPRDYTKAIDMWGVGCIMVEMLTGKPLFPGSNEMDQIGLIIDVITLNDNEWNTLTQILPTSVLRSRSRVPKIPLKSKLKDYDDNVVDLLEKLLVFDPNKRLTAEEALAHPYLQIYSCPEDEPIVLKSFHIEHEVDELSPKTMRKLISQESTEKLDMCGSHSNTDAADNKHQMRNNKGQIDSLNTQCLDQRNRNLSVSSSDSNDSLKEIIQTSLDTDSKEREANLLGSLTKENLELNIVVNLPEDDTENKKEKDQLSPKEKNSKLEKEGEKAEDSEIDKYLESANEKEIKLSRYSDSKTVAKQFTCPKVKDRLNEVKRAESPRENVDRLHKLDMRGATRNRIRDKGKGDNFKQEKMKKNKNNKYNESGAHHQDFDSIYRLPTEHLTRRRNSRQADRLIQASNKVKHHLKLHEHLNEKLKLAELEQEHCFGAAGGNMISPGDIRDDIRSTEDLVRSRSGSGSSSSTEPSREESPSGENPQRRLEH